MYNYLAGAIGALATVVLIVGAAFGLYNWLNPVEPTLVNQERCEFVVKTNSKAAFAESMAGEFNYEVFITPDGYIEVYRCP